MIKPEEIGKNAGIVWQTLYGKGRQMSAYEIMKSTELGRSELLLAIGWLAREDKIEISQQGHKEYFSLKSESFFH